MWSVGPLYCPYIMYIVYMYIALKLCQSIFFNSLGLSVVCKHLVKGYFTATLIVKCPEMYDGSKFSGKSYFVAPPHLDDKNDFVNQIKCEN